MPIEIEWRTSHSASCLHAAEAHASHQPLADAELEQSIRAAADALQQEITSSGLPPQRLWSELVTWAAVLPNNEDLARQAVVKSGGTPDRHQSLVVRLAGQIGGLEAAVTRARPRLADELSLRTGPLREQWEARGPGLLHQLEHLTTKELIPERAQVTLVHPALGGAGRAHLPSNSVRIEALLVNVDPRLPEVVRLGWLLAQLQCDLPRFSERLAAERLPLIAQLAMLPAVLAAAERSDLAPADGEALALAITLWRIELPAGVTTDVLIRWWETYVEARPPWDVALRALEQMLVRS